MHLRLPAAYPAHPLPPLAAAFFAQLLLPSSVHPRPVASTAAVNVKESARAFCAMRGGTSSCAKAGRVACRFPTRCVHAGKGMPAVCIHKTTVVFVHVQTTIRPLTHSHPHCAHPCIVPYCTQHEFKRVQRQ